jgi:ABC-type multidrug transport system permease subunit
MTDREMANAIGRLLGRMIIVVPLLTAIGIVLLWLLHAGKIDAATAILVFMLAAVLS